uniref:Type 1 fimbrial protein n=1 Tax=Pseudomonas tritici TaxID=2745518 RepID=A0A8I0CWY9_9PSED
MKNLFLAFTLSTIFLTGAVQAGDHPATIDIRGSVTGTTNDCFLSFSKDNANTAIATLSSKINDLPNQGQNATNPNWIDYMVSGCESQVAVELHGTADDADGTTLANTDNSESSAKGVGIGLFDENLAPLNINSNQIVLNPVNGKAHGKFNLQLVKLNGKTPVEGGVHGSLTVDIVRL